MEKYPSVYSLREFTRVLEALPELLDLEGYVEPKYDGSNITIMDGVARTRNLHPLPAGFAHGLRAALGDRFDALLALSREYQVFLELGGRANSPAGYDGPWRGEWDYVVFDLLRGGVFLEPPEAREIVEDKYGLRFVEYRRVRVVDAIRGWQRLLAGEYREYEGFVLKIYPPLEILRRIPHHRQRNAVIAKFKHEYRGIVVRVGGKRRKREALEDRREELPRSEVMGAINKAHAILGHDIYDRRKAMPLIFRLVREEAEKHGYRVPPAPKLFRYYQEYIRRLG